jgi:hypothetical protein
VKGRLDRWLLVGVVLVLLTGTLAAQQGVQYASYRAWMNATEGERYSYISGIMGGSYYVGTYYMIENPGKNLPPIDHLIPKEHPAGFFYDMINRVYARPENREIPIVAIVCNWRRYVAQYGR